MSARQRFSCWAQVDPPVWRDHHHLQVLSLLETGGGTEAVSAAAQIGHAWVPGSPAAGRWHHRLRSRIASAAGLGLQLFWDSVRTVRNFRGMKTQVP